MHIVLRLSFIFGTLALLTGCQCTPLYEPYNDLIDEISECPPHFDRFYEPCLDLNRIGKPNWCRCWFNRALCGRACRIPNSPAFPPPDAYHYETPPALGVASGRALKQFPQEEAPAEMTPSGPPAPAPSAPPAPAAPEPE